nr:SpoIIE family protein phosphatase [Lachnospiraceae bacterium]
PYNCLCILATPNSDRSYLEYSEIINEDGEPVLKFDKELFDFINIFAEEEFSKSAEELKKQMKMNSLKNDNIRKNRNLVFDEVTYRDKEYLMSGINIRGTNLFFIHLVDKNETEAYQAELKKKLETFQSLQEKMKKVMEDMFVFFAVMSIIVLIIMSLVSTIVSGRISKPIQNLICDAQIIGEGNLEHQVDIHTGDELEQLGSVFNQMTSSLKNYMENLRQATMEQERISTELNVAASIQLDMLPRVFPAFPEETSFDIWAFMHPAKEVGGDYYDYFMLDDRHLVTVIADVSGKGVPAALFMMMGKTLMRSQAAYLNNPAEIMEKVNKSLNENNDEMMFITGFFSILNLVTGELTYANAGHNAPLLYRAETEKYEYLIEDADLVLAIMEDTTYKEHRIFLNPGDKLFLYTDGVTEAVDMEGGLYGEEHLKEVMNRREMKELSGEELINTLNQDIREFANGAGQADDITMVVVSYLDYKQIEEVEDGMRKLTVGANQSNLDRVLEFIRQMLKDGKAPEEIINSAWFVVDEMFTNIASYAYPDRRGEAVIIGDMTNEDKIIIHIEDEGIPYNPLKKENPDVELPVESREIGGLGIYLVKNMADEMKYCYEEGRNKLTLVISWGKKT